jgi:hypothetical protein
MQAPPPPPKPAPVVPAQQPARRFTSGMNFVTLEEIIEADTTVVPAAEDKPQSSDGSRNVTEKS